VQNINELQAGELLDSIIAYTWKIRLCLSLVEMDIGILLITPSVLPKFMKNEGQIVHPKFMSFYVLIPTVEMK
jgi:hypothetical protein